MGSVQRAIAVLDALAEGGAELGTNEIARRTGINASSISRLLSTLTEAGLVQHLAGTGRYRLGVRILQLASAARENLDLRAVARPLLAELAQVSGETVTLSLPGEHDVLTVDFVQSSRSVRSVAEIGRNSVAHATATGKVFLACGGHLPEGDLTAYTDLTITDRTALATRIEEIATQGYALALRERDKDLSAVAVPVLDGGQQLIAIIGIQGPATRFDVATMTALVPAMRDRAALIAAAF
ncbi:MAG: IclR family transcriptional regulator [Geodermatophilaceae bacterium]|nr:IclR family transcriptional regulator [Geodermatophilaceae bacterium]